MFPTRLTKGLLAAGVLALSPLLIAGEYENRADVQAFAEETAREFGLSKTDILNKLAQAERQQRIIDLISKPAEKAKPWHEYRLIFMTDKRITEGAQFWRENEQVLQEVSEKYQVAPEMIVAIIGVETSYGKIKGSFRVIDALSTLAFDYPPRQTFFRKELANFFKLSAEQKHDPLTLKGSYAGAMGYGQFMPSSYRAYAVDHDQDGFADIWENRKDAIASVANYFAKHGWKANDPVVTRAIVQDSAKADALISKNLKPNTTIGELAKHGITPTMAGLTPDRPAVLIRQQGSQGPEYWLGFNNFYTITRYNISSMYAMAAHELAQAIKQEKAAQ